MSTSIDNRIVEMQFDNSQFEKGVAKSLKSLEQLKKGLKLDEASESLNKLQKAGDSFSLAKIADGIENLTYRVSWMGRTIAGVIDNITYRAKSMIKFLSVDQITSGWSKYADKTAYVQTIMNATGKSIEDVNKYLDKLMWFSDETSYSFVDMTQALGTLTSSGGDIDKLIPMLEGMANATAFAGKSAAEFQRTMYNLNQSYSSGYMQYIDWKSVEMAGVGSEQLKQSFIDAGKALGTLTKEGKTKKGTLVSIANFGSTLNEKWADTRVMEKAFGTFSEMTEKAYELIQEGKFDTASDAYAYLATQYTGVGITAAKAAQEAKSFNEAIAATTDAVSSGWMKTFEVIFGNYDEAKVMWTDLANWLWDVFASGAEARNELLETWKDLGGRTTMLEGIYSMFEAFNNLLYAIKDAWASVFPQTTADDLLKISNGIKSIGDKIKEAFNYEETENVVDQFTKAVAYENPLGQFWGQLEKGTKGEDVKKLQQKLYDLGYDIGKSGVDGIFGPKTKEALEKFQKDSKIKPTGIFDEKTFEKLGESLNSAFNKFTPIFIDETTEKVEKFGSVLDKVRVIFKGAFSAIHIGWTTIKSIASAIGKVFGIFSPIADVVLTVLAKISGGIINADEAISNNGFVDALSKLETFLSPIKQRIQSFADAIKIFFKLEEVGDEAKKAARKFVAAFEAVRDWLGDKIPVAVTYLTTAFSNVKDWLGDKIPVAVTYLTTAFSNVKDWLGDKIPVAVDKFIEIFNKAKEAVKYFFGIDINGDSGAKQLLDKVIEIFNKAKEAVKYFFGIGVDGDSSAKKLLDNIVSFVSKIGNLDEIKAFFDKFIPIFTKIGEWFKTKYESVSSAISNGISGIKDFLSENQGLAIALSGIYVFFRLLSVAKTIYGLIENFVELRKLEAKAKIAENSDPNKMSKLFLSIGVTIALVAMSIKYLGTMSTGQFVKGTIGLSLCIGSIIGLLITFAILQKKSKGLDVKSVSRSLLFIGSSIALMAGSIFVIGKLPIAQLIKGIFGLGVLLGMIVGVIYLLNVIGKTGGIKIKLKGFLELAGAIAIIAGIAVLLGMVDFLSFLKGIGMMSIVIGMLLGVMVALSIVSKGSLNLNLSGIFQLSLAIGIMSVLAIGLSKIKFTTLINGLGKLLLVSGILIGFVIALSFISRKSGGNLNIAIKGLLQMSLAIGIMAGIAVLLGKTNTRTLIKGVAALGFISAFLAGLVFVVGKFGSGIKASKIIAMVAGLALLSIAFSYAISMVKDVDWTVMVAFTASLVFAMGAFVALCIAADKFGSKMISGSAKLMLSLGIIIGSIAGIAVLLGKIDEWTNGGFSEAIRRGAEVLDAIGNVLAALGSAIGRMIGSITAGFMDVNSEALNRMSEALTNFNEAFDSLKMGVAGVSDDEQLKVDTASALDLAKTIKQFFDDIGLETQGISTANVDNFNNRVDTIVTSLGTFGTSIAQIREGIAGISSDGDIHADTSSAITVALAIKEEFFDVIGEDTYAIDALDLIAYNKQLTAVLAHIKTFGENMGIVVTNLSGISSTDIETDVDTALACARAISRFFSELNGPDYDIEEMKGSVAEMFTTKTETDSVIDRIKTMGENLKSMHTDIAGISLTTLESDVETMTNAYTMVAGLMSYLGGDTYNEETGQMSNLKNDLRMMGEGITEFASSIEGIDTSEVSSVATTITEMLNSVMSTSIPKGVNTGNTYVSMFVELGANFMKGMANGMHRNESLVTRAVQIVAQKAIRQAQITFDSHSPSRVAMQLGKYWDQGFANGVEKYASLSTNSVDSMANEAISTLSSMWTMDVPSDPVIRPIVDMSDVANGAKAINSMMSGTRNLDIASTTSVNAGKAAASMKYTKQNQNGTSAQTSAERNDGGNVNLSGNNFYIRSDNDVKMLASELANLTKQQQRSLGSPY